MVSVPVGLIVAGLILFVAHDLEGFAGLLFRGRRDR